MLILGLTGSIGSGKSTCAGIFSRLGVPVFDADRTVHELYAGEAVSLVEAQFSGVTADGAIDRARLAERVVGDPLALAKLETIVHPLVQDKERVFLANAARSAAPMVILEIPLLFETGAYRRVDAIVVTHVSDQLRFTRVMARKGMSEQKYTALMAKQMPSSEKCRRAHFVIESAHGELAAQRDISDIIRALISVPGRVWNARSEQ